MRISDWSSDVCSSDLAVEQVAEPRDIGQPLARIGPGGFEEQMVGLIFLQHVEDQVGRKGHLLARLALARMLALDQPADDRDLAERTLQKVRSLDPFDELLGQYLGIEQIDRKSKRLNYSN